MDLLDTATYDSFSVETSLKWLDFAEHAYTGIYGL